MAKKKKAQAQESPRQESPVREAEVDNPLEALDAWRREAEAAEAKAMEDAEQRAADRAAACTTLASTAQVEEAVEVEPGAMRLQGMFQGTATTHTHQLDLAVGIDLEMPSEMAAEAMRQLGSVSRGASPVSLRLAEAAEDPDPSADRSMWNTLSDFFRRDARNAAREQASERRLPQVKLCLEDHTAERRQLASRLESTEGQAAMVEAQYLILQEERDELAHQLELATETQMEQAAHIDALRNQGEKFLASGDDVGKQLNEREEEVRDLEAKLAEALPEMETLRASLAEEKAARQRLQATWTTACDSSTVLGEENASLRILVAELRASLAGLEAKADALQQIALSPSKKEFGSPGREADDDAQEKLASLSERVQALATERDELRAQLGAASATAEAAQAHARELEAKVGELTGKAAEVEARCNEAQRRADESAGEAERLREDAAQQATAYQRAAEKAKLSEQGYAADVLALKQQLSEEVARTQQARREASEVAAAALSGNAKAKSAQSVAQLQKEVQGLREEAHRQSAELHAERQGASLARDTLQDECKRRSAGEAAARTECEAAKQELRQARVDHAAALAAKAAVDAETSRSEQASERMHREHGELLAKVGALSALEQAREAEIRELKSQLESFEAKDSKLGGSSADMSLLTAEVKRVKALLAAEETATTQLRAQQVSAAKAAEASRSKADQTSRRLEELETRTADQLGNAERRVEAAAKEAREAAQRAKEASAERDKARRELREARQGGLGDESKLREELHAKRHEELKNAGEGRRDLEDELSKLKRRCFSLEAVRDELARELNAARGFSAYGGQHGSVLLQDNSGACLIRSIKTVPGLGGSFVAAPQPVPSGHSGLFPSGSVAASVNGPPGSTMPEMPRATLDGKRMSYLGTTMTTTVNGVPVATNPGAPLDASFSAFGAAASPVPTMSGPPGMSLLVPREMSQPYLGQVLHAAPVRIATAMGQVKAKMSVQVVGVRRIQR